MHCYNGQLKENGMLVRTMNYVKYIVKNLQSLSLPQGANKYVFIGRLF